MVGSWGSVQADWTIVFALLIGWYVLIRTWERNGPLTVGMQPAPRDRFDGANTARSAILDWMARPRRFWRRTVKSPFGFVRFHARGGAGCHSRLCRFLSSHQPLATFSQRNGRRPGLNPVIPLGWGALAFVVSLVIHEFGHGLLARGHGMRIRSFGLLQLGPLPLGAFAEPQSDELMRAPRRERLRMFAAGPATNLFAAFIMLLLLGGLATQIVAEEDYIHVQGIVVDGGADQAGMQPWDTLVSIDGQPVHTTDDFRDILVGYKSNDTVDMVVIHQDGTRETLQATFSDKYQYYLDLGWSEDLLANLESNLGMRFLAWKGFPKERLALTAWPAPSHLVSTATSPARPVHPLPHPDHSVDTV